MVTTTFSYATSILLFSKLPQGIGHMVTFIDSWLNKPILMATNIETVTFFVGFHVLDIYISVLH